MDDDIRLDNEEEQVLDDEDIRVEDESDNQPSSQTSEPLGYDMEQGPKEELSEVLEGFKSRARREDQRFMDAVDSEYWVAFCFQTREQKEEFLNKLNLIELGDKYIDGMQAAKIMGVRLKSRVPKIPRYKTFDQEFVDISLDFEE